MARISVDEIQSRVASITDLDETTSNIDSTEYSIRTKYINRAQQEWAEINDWQTLYKECKLIASTSTGNMSVVLPDDFRKLASYPRIADGTDNPQFPEVLPQEDGQYGASDKRVWILGSPSGGYILRVFGVTLASGASIVVPYYKSPASLVSPANIADVPNAEYLVQRTIAYVWEAKGDERAQLAKTEAEKILRNMIEFENVPNFASAYQQIKTTEETKYNFRLGRD